MDDIDRTISIQAFENFRTDLTERVTDTGWTASLAFSPRLQIYHCLIHPEAMAMPTLTQRSAQDTPTNFYELETRDLEMMKIAIDQVLTSHNL